MCLPGRQLAAGVQPVGSSSVHTRSNAVPTLPYGSRLPSLPSPLLLPSHTCPSLQSLCAVLLERFKEKNIVMSKAAEESLRTLAQHCFTLADVAEEVTKALGHNNPKGG